MIHKDNLASFEMSCSGKMGGFAKNAEANADVLHTYYSICTLSMAADAAWRPYLHPVSAQYGLSQRAVDWINERCRK